MEPLFPQQLACLIQEKKKLEHNNEMFDHAENTTKSKHNHNIIKLKITNTNFNATSTGEKEAICDN